MTAPDFTKTETELYEALERIVASLQSNGAWKVANALAIAKGALSKRDRASPSQ